MTKKQCEECDSERFKFDDVVYDEVFLKKKIIDTKFNREYDCSLKNQEALCDLLNKQDKLITYQKRLIMENKGEKMTAKIDRFKINDNGAYIEKYNVGIIDYLEYRTIVEFMTDDKDLNLRLAKIILDELNEEFKE